MLFKYSFLILCTIFISCGEDAIIQENTALEKQLIGEWCNVSMKLTMNSFKNRDTVKTFEVAEGTWEKKMNIRPIITTFRSDGTYNSAHSNLKDSVFYNPAGRWAILGDTLIMRDTFPEPGLSYRYKITFNKDVVEFEGIEDCDRDGKADDNYYGKQRRRK